MSHPFSLFPFHAKPGLTRFELLKRAFCRQRGEEVPLPGSEDDKCIAIIFVKFQLSKGTIFEMPHRVLNVFSLYKLPFLTMIA